MTTQTINFFYVVDEEGNESLRPRNPQVTSLTELKRLVSEGKPDAAIQAHAKLCADGLNWAKYDEWKAAQDKYEAELADVLAYNEDPSLDEDNNPILKEVPTQPSPLGFTESTVETVLTSIQDTIDKVTTTKSKLEAFTFNDVVCSVTEADQNGWGALTVLIDNAINTGIPFSPIPFKNENGNTVLIETREEWTTFILTAAQARQEFFG